MEIDDSFIRSPSTNERTNEQTNERTSTTFGERSICDDLRRSARVGRCLRECWLVGWLVRSFTPLLVCWFVWLLVVLVACSFILASTTQRDAIDCCGAESECVCALRGAVGCGCQSCVAAVVLWKVCSDVHASALLVDFSGPDSSRGVAGCFLLPRLRAVSYHFRLPTFPVAAFFVFLSWFPRFTRLLLVSFVALAPELECRVCVCL